MFLTFLINKLKERKFSKREQLVYDFIIFFFMINSIAIGLCPINACDKRALGIHIIVDPMCVSTQTIWNKIKNFKNKIKSAFVWI